MRKFAFVALLGCGLAVTPPAVAAPWAGTCSQFHCAGMELAQDDAPKGNEPDDHANGVAPPDSGAAEPDTQPPGDDQASPDVITPPSDDGTDPPGCLFTKQPLELLV